jgi:hypothetical protein
MLIKQHLKCILFYVFLKFYLKWLPNSSFDLAIYSPPRYKLSRIFEQTYIMKLNTFSIQMY